MYSDKRSLTIKAKNTYFLIGFIVTFLVVCLISGRKIHRTLLYYTKGYGKGLT